MSQGVCCGCMYQRIKDLLNEAIAFAATSILLLQLDKLQLTKGREDLLKVFLGDREMNVSNVESVERYAVRLGWGAVSDTSLSVLLGFSQLNDDRNTQELLSG